MADKKIEKALYGPSLAEVALGALLGLLAGVAAACVYLVFKPVQQVKELPKEPSRAVVYYLPGSESTAKSRGWQAKEKQLVGVASISVVEDELNAWAAASLGAPAAAAKPKPAGQAGAKGDAASPAVPEGFVIPGKPNFRIVGDKLQIGLKCTLNWYGFTHETTVIATGIFRKSGDAFEFSPDTLYLGSCPLHLVPAASGFLVSTITGKQKVTDELRVALTKLTAVTIEGGALKLAVQ